MLISRRSALAELASLALHACSRCSEAKQECSRGSWKELSFSGGSGTTSEGQLALFRTDAGTTAPVLIALHGRGESGRGLRVGAAAWRDDYWLDRMYARLCNAPLKAADFQNLVEAERLKKINASLARTRFQGLRVLCPYTSDLPDKSPMGALDYTQFVVRDLLPKALSIPSVEQKAVPVGIDGVSMGGRLALLIGFAHPELFDSVGALQPAIKREEAELFSGSYETALSKRPFKLRLVTSENDPFRPAVEATSNQMTKDSLPHELLVLPGNHDYTWNRGPGGLEMLFFHDRTLNRVT